MAEPDDHFDPDKEEDLMKEDRPEHTLRPGEAEPGTSKPGEAEPFMKERDTFGEDQLLNVLHETSMPVLEDQVAQVDK
eukprot:8742470-Prorocentrum_lima.AAC.1